MQTFDVAYLKKMGFAFATDAEATLFAEIVSAEFEKRLSEQKMLLMDEDDYFLFDDESSAEENNDRKIEDSPEYRAMYRQCMLELIRELCVYRAEIAGLLAASKPVPLTTPIEELDLSVRSFNCLKRAGIGTVGEIIAYGDLKSIYNLGRKNYEEIMGVLSEMGII